MRLDRFDVRRGSTVVVLGAHWGEATKFFSEKVGPTGKVLSVEPEMENFQILREAIADLGNVRIDNVAIGQHTKMGYLNVGTNDVNHSIVRHFDGKSQMIQICTWDRLVEMHGFRVVDLVKVDIEGAEIQWLKGMTHTFPKHIIMEEHSRFAYTLEELETWLSAKGYVHTQEGRDIYATR